MDFSCSDPPIGWTTDSTDCDDFNATIFPNAPEINDNAIDEDCDGNLGVDITEANALSLMTIFPNPNAQGYFYISGGIELGEVRIYNSQGQCVQTGMPKEGGRFDFKLASGMYQVMVQSGADLHCFRLMVQ